MDHKYRSEQVEYFNKKDQIKPWKLHDWLHVHLTELIPWWCSMCCIIVRDRSFFLGSINVKDTEEATNIQIHIAFLPWQPYSIQYCSRSTWIAQWYLLLTIPVVYILTKNIIVFAFVVNIIYVSNSDVGGGSS